MNQVFSPERATEVSPGRLPVVSRRKSKASRKGRYAFTLVELLVVVAILALLVSILLPTLDKARERAKMAVCKINLKGLGVAFGEYVGANNQWYPACMADGGVIYGDGAGPEYAWDTILYPYFKNFGLLHCPSDNIDRTSYYENYNVPQEKRYPRSYGMNADVSWAGPSLYGASRPQPYVPPYPWPAHVKKVSTVTNPAETILLADTWESDYGLWYSSTYYHYSPNTYGDYQGSWVGRYAGANSPCPGRMPTFYHRNNDAANFLLCDGSVMLLDEDNPNVTDANGYYYYFRVKP